MEYKKLFKIQFTIVIVFQLFLIFSCSKKKSNMSEKYDGPISITDNLDAIFKDSNRTVVKIFAAIREEYKNGNQIFKDSVFVTFYNEEGQKTSTLQSKYAFYDKSSDRWIVKDSVRLRNLTKEETLQTEELIYERKKNKIYTDKFVQIFTPDYRIFGEGLETDEKFEHYKIHRVKGKIYLDTK